MYNGVRITNQFDSIKVVEENKTNLREIDLTNALRETGLIDLFYGS